MDGSPHPELHPLEPRRLLAAAPAPVQSGDQLAFAGTGKSDVITIARDRRRASKVVVIVNGAGYKFSSATLRTIVGDAGPGNDSVTVDSTWGTVSQALSVTGGDGDDTLGGSLGYDTLNGNAGNDLLMGAGGNDSLWAGDDDDTIYGGRGNDTLKGEDGADLLEDGRGSDVLDGGTGIDTVNGAADSGPGGGNDTGVNARPDLQIKLKAEGAYAGDNTYNTSGSNQSKSAPGGFFPTLYHVRVQNDSSIADSFLITATPTDPAKWRVRVYDSQTTGYDGGVNVSDLVTGKGWNTGSIAPGATKDFRLEVLPLYGSLGNAAKLATVTATSRNNPARTDTVATTTTYTPAPNLEIRRQNFDKSGSYLTTIQNYGNVIDRAKITGPASGDGYTVRYFDTAFGGNDVTDQVTGSGYLTPEIAPREAVPLRVEIDASDNKGHSIQLDVKSTYNPNVGDFAIISNRPSPATGPDFFIIGAWSQPRGSFAKWKDRGVNTMVQYESAQATIQEWTQAAVDNGLYMIRRPVPGVVGDVGQKNLIGWAHPDEPDIPSTGHDATYIANEYANWKKVDPDMPIFTNFSGGYVNKWQGNPLVGYSGYKPLLDNTDWVGSSIYPVTGWDRPDDLDAPGKAVDRLEKYSEGKPQFAVIETSDQELPWAAKDIPGPTPGQFRAQVWDSIIRGAKGIIYFPQKFKPQFSFDNTPPEIDAEMRVQNARITALSDVILSPIDPPTMGIALGGPLEASWRFHDGKAYFIVLNTSGESTTQAISLQGVGKPETAQVVGESRSVSLSKATFTDTFAPHEAHVYAVG
jgi:hypothetical protein